MGLWAKLGRESKVKKVSKYSTVHNNWVHSDMTYLQQINHILSFCSAKYDTPKYIKMSETHCDIKFPVFLIDTPLIECAATQCDVGLTLK